ncbi:MAG: aromatic ring-hydroxylating dioxygenase subunit alpha, partial [Betaproteobacteria bacterium]
DKPLSAEEHHHMEQGKGIHCEFVPGTFRPLANRDNDYLIDRRAQKEKRAFSGVFGISIQDASLQESMGSIQDHAREKLLPTDRAIVMARRMLHEAATALQTGSEPPALDAAKQRVRAAGVLLEHGAKPQDWAKVHLADAANQPVYSI